MQHMEHHYCDVPLLDINIPTSSLFSGLPDDFAKLKKKEKKNCIFIFYFYSVLTLILNFFEQTTVGKKYFFCLKMGVSVSGGLM